MRTTISSKLFLGFLAVIFLNVFFVAVVSRFADLYGISRILGWHNDVENGLLRIAALHDDQRTHYVIYEKLRRGESALNFLQADSAIQLRMDTVLSHLESIETVDRSLSEDASSQQIRARLGTLRRTLSSDIAAAAREYREAFDGLAAASEGTRTSRARRDSLVRAASAASDSLSARLRRAEQYLDAQTKARLADIEWRIENARNVTMLILAGMSVFALIFAFVFSRAITTSLRRLQHAASEVAKGNFDIDSGGYPADEVGDLAAAFAGMAQDLQVAQEELVHSKRLAAIGEIVASVNHEINNPLMIISGNAQFLEMAMQDAPEDVKGRVKAIIEETDRISRITRKLRGLKRPITDTYTARGEQMIDLDKSSEPDTDTPPGGEGA
jgi:nitrogen fixation/metabolism regulation signal transduction histidine kinase